MFQKEDKLAGLFSGFKERVYLKKDIILSANTEYGMLYYIKSGIVRSFHTDEDGNELTINFLKPGAVFPLSGYLAGRENPYDFEAFTKVTLFKAPKEKIKYLIYNNAEIASHYLEKFAQGIEGYVVRSRFLAIGSAMQKVASSILLLSRRFGAVDGGHMVIELPLTHQDIANLAGITRETVSIQIGILRKEKVISARAKKIIVLDMEKLSQKASEGDGESFFNLSF